MNRYDKIDKLNSKYYWLLNIMQKRIYVSMHPLKHPWFSFATHNLDIENQIGVGRDIWLCSWAIGSSWWASNICFHTDTHLHHSTFPASNNSIFSKSKSNWVSGWNGRIEYLTVSGQGTGVLDLSGLSNLALWSSSLFEYIQCNTIIKFGFSKVLRSLTSWWISSSYLSCSTSFSSGSSFNLSLSLCLSFSLSLSNNWWVDCLPVSIG